MDDIPSPPRRERLLLPLAVAVLCLTACGGSPGTPPEPNLTALPGWQEPSPGVEPPSIAPSRSPKPRPTGGLTASSTPRPGHRPTPSQVPHSPEPHPGSSPSPKSTPQPSATQAFPQPTSRPEPTPMAPQQAPRPQAVQLTERLDSPVLIGSGSTLEFDVDGLPGVDNQTYFLVCELMTDRDGHLVPEGDYIDVVQFGADRMTKVAVAANVGNFFAEATVADTMGCFVVRATTREGLANLLRLAADKGATVVQDPSPDGALPHGCERVSTIIPIHRRPPGSTGQISEGRLAARSVGHAGPWWRWDSPVVIRSHPNRPSEPRP